MKNAFTFLCLAMGTYIWLGHSSGAAARQDADRTGGPLSENGDTFCSRCHSGGEFGTDVHLTLLSAPDGDTITEYIPETAYTLRVSITAEGASAYGFQAVALAEDTTQAGTYGDAPAGTAVVAVGGVDYAEHSERDDDGTWDLIWNAPSVGTGPVTFYAAGNAVSNAGDGPSGDHPDTTSLQIPEALGAGIADVNTLIQMQLAPNPVTDFVVVQWSSDEIDLDQLRIVSATGQLMHQRLIEGGISKLELAVRDYPTGVYFVQATSPEGIQTKRFMKL